MRWWEPSSWVGAPKVCRNARTRTRVEQSGLKLLPSTRANSMSAEWGEWGVLLAWGKINLPSRLASKRLAQYFSGGPSERRPIKHCRQQGTEDHPPANSKRTKIEPKSVLSPNQDNKVAPNERNGIDQSRRTYFSASPLNLRPLIVTTGILLETAWQKSSH